MSSHRSFQPGRRRRTGCLVQTRAALGFTLIEVMVALIILVLGVLGAAAMNLAALRDGKQSGLRSQASAFAYELSDLMRASRGANPSPESVFTGPVPAAVTTCWSNAGCSPTDMAANDYYEWHEKLTGAGGLPNGDAVICRDATKLDQYPQCDDKPTSPLVVKLRWDEKNNNARDAASTTGAAPTAVTMRTMSVPIQPY